MYKADALRYLDALRCHIRHHTSCSDCVDAVRNPVKRGVPTDGCLLGKELYAAMWQKLWIAQGLPARFV